MIKYREIAGFPGYRVGDDGSVWCKRPVNGKTGGVWKWRKLKPFPVTKAGHLRIDLHIDDGKRNCRYVHRLVLEAFVGPCPEGMECCHFPDWNPGNNALSNLRWDTHKGNSGDMRSHGTRLIGEKNPHARLNESTVKSIKEEYRNGIDRGNLGVKYGISRGHVNDILAGRKWSHVA